jgi:hypothetical protein
MKSFTSLMPALHAMRSAELAQYLDKASGGLKQKPESLKAYFNGLGSVTEPMSTGINATRYTTPKAGGNQPAQGGGMIRAIDDKGVLHEAPKGTPLPKGWKAQ